MCAECPVFLVGVCVYLGVCLTGWLTCVMFFFLLRRLNAWDICCRWAEGRRKIHGIFWMGWDGRGGSFVYQGKRKGRNYVFLTMSKKERKQQNRKHAAKTGRQLVYVLYM